MMDDKTQVKIEELEKQLQSVTQQRLDYLEKLQQQQMAWQVSQCIQHLYWLGRSVSAFNLYTGLAGQSVHSTFIPAW